MPRVRVLSDALVNRIAAGEVVERPASIVKELVENSLDAGASRIEVELQAGGRSLVRVIDDGCGMDEDDALLSLERHATSKISSLDDLEGIATMGFRGEALPSIAAVSRFSLVTCADPTQGGVRITVEGGRIAAVEGVPRTRGTTAQVRDLFFNLPARRKFLHAPETELRHAQEVVWAASLACPDIGFTLRHGPRTLLELLPVTDAAARLADLTRRRGSGSAYRFEAEGGGVRIWGLLLPVSGRGRTEVTALVNGRPVRDRLLLGVAMRTLRQAGSGFGRSRLVLFVDVPPDLVDVNVHPTKAEVRFARAGAVFAVLERALRSGLAAAQGIVDVDRFEPATRDPSPDPAEVPPPQHTATDIPPPSLFPHPVYDARPAAQPTGGGEQPPGPTPEAAAATGIETAPGTAAGTAPQRSHITPGLPPDTPFGRLLGQYRRSFLLLEDPQGLAIIDQHAAHERVLYDQVLRRLASDPPPSQGLLVPVLIEVDEALATALPRVQGLLRQAGIEVEPFGTDTVRLVSLPGEVNPAAAQEIVCELLSRATDRDGVPERMAEELAEELASSIACHAAIKVNHTLAPQEQRALLRDLAASNNPYRCPHGRPIVLRLTQEEMERRLGRR